ncbi:MAG: DUF5906 domain-containing protein, partial [Lachnospiraceae bacterium]|nr:DUF5906 domain-containing protein [Lachnospiraceae bacterium]
MKEDWNNITEEQKKALEQVAKLMEQKSKSAEDNPEGVDWYDGKRINDSLFCEYFLRLHPMKCIRGMLFDIDGRIDDVEKIKTEIYEKIEPYAVSNIAKKANSLLDALKIKCYAPPPPIMTDRIHFKNGTYFMDGTFRTEKEFCMNRFSVSYNPKASKPETWFRFMEQLLEPEDINSLQEYMGYLLIPSTKGQKLMIIKGKGGEGKSRIGRVLRAIMGDNMNTGSIQKVETDRFARADLEWKLVMLDDDMKLEALPQTNNIKSIVTLEDKTDLERKGKQSEQGILYVRFICFGNGNLGSLYDRSDGFFRRQLILSVKEKDINRMDDPYLGEKLIAEAEGIVLWCLEGLHRLIANKYQFTVSERSKENIEEAMGEGNNILMFMESVGYIRIEKGTHAASRQLYIAYQQWCA